MMLKKWSMFLLLFLPMTALAQFQGDVFFLEPSIVVEKGQAGELEAAAFVGSVPLGAVYLELNFEPTEMEIVEVLPGNSPELQKGFTVKIAAGRISVVALNSESLTDPFGTVSIARFRVKPIGNEGSRTTVALTVRDMLQQDSVPYSSFRGFAGEVIVAAAQGPQAAIGKSAAPRATADEALIERASALGPVGSAVKLREADYSETTILLLDPSAPSEARPRE